MRDDPAFIEQKNSYGRLAKENSEDHVSLSRSVPNLVLSATRYCRPHADKIIRRLRKMSHKSSTKPWFRTTIRSGLSDDPDSRVELHRSADRGKIRGTCHETLGVARISVP